MYGGVLADVTTNAVSPTPVVVSFCGSDLLGAFGSGLFRTLMTRYGVIASHRAAARAQRIVVKSKGLRDALPAHVNRSKVIVIPNGVDLDRFRPIDQSQCRRRRGWNAGRMHVLFCDVASDPRKRPELARAAVAALANRGIAVELHYLSGVSHEDVPSWINASDALLVTSFAEGSPNIVKETLACDVPVVSVDVGDVGEQISGLDGCYIAAADPLDLANKLGMVFARASRVAGRHQMRDLSLQQVARRLANLYRDLLATTEDPQRPDRAEVRAEAL
jgi:glycosyltransferase involved in cell wall biosynthesis